MSQEQLFDLPKESLYKLDEEQKKYAKQMYFAIKDKHKTLKDDKLKAKVVGQEPFSKWKSLPMKHALRCYIDGIHAKAKIGESDE